MIGKFFQICAWRMQWIVNCGEWKCKHVLVFLSIMRMVSFLPCFGNKMLDFSRPYRFDLKHTGRFRVGFFSVECWIVAFFAQVDGWNAISTIPFLVPDVVYIIGLLSRLQFFLSHWALTSAYLFDTPLQCEDFVTDHLSWKTHMARMWWLEMPRK